jgi:hypothetical protein
VQRQLALIPRVVLLLRAAMHVRDGLAQAAIGALSVAIAQHMDST